MAEQDTAVEVEADAEAPAPLDPELLARRRAALNRSLSGSPAAHRRRIAARYRAARTAVS